MHKMAPVQLTSKNDLPNRENPISVLSFFYFKGTFNFNHISLHFHFALFGTLAAISAQKYT